MNETIQPIRTSISQPAGELPIPVFYSPAMVADSRSFSPSAGKPALAVKSWQFLGLPLQFYTPKPLSAEQFGVAHDPEFVADVLSRRRDNGFGNKSPAVAASLPLTSGAMLSAAREALKNRIGAIAPCSGFHHAGYDFAGGFCTFNGLMVTATVLLAEGKARKVGILDFDQHWGNGTQDIIDRLHLDNEVVHYSPSEYSRPAKAEAFLAAIKKILERFAGCDLVLYRNVLAKSMDAARFKKEALYSSRKMGSRLAAKEEFLAMSLDEESAKASFLRRKTAQGKAQFRKAPDEPQK